MKKLALVLAIVLIASFAVVGCTISVETPGESTNTQTSESASAPDSTSAEDSTPSTTYTATFYDFANNTISTTKDAVAVGTLMTGLVSTEGCKICTSSSKPADGGSKAGYSFTVGVQLGKATTPSYAKKTVQFTTTVANQTVEVYAGASGDKTEPCKVCIIDASSNVIDTQEIVYSKNSCSCITFTIATPGNYAVACASANVDDAASVNMWGICY